MSASAPSAPVPAPASERPFRPVITPYFAVSRFRNSQHLDNDPKIARYIGQNRLRFDQFAQELSNHASCEGLPDNAEFTKAIEFLELAKDAWGRGLIHGVGKRGGVPFETAVLDSVLASRDAAEDQQAAQTEAAASD